MKKSFLKTLLIPFIFLASCEFQSYTDYETPEYDGELEWTQVIKNAEWSNRYGHASAVFQDKIWLVGGYNPGQVKGDTYYEDVWSSADGKSWELVNDNAPFYGRKGHCLVTFDDGNGEALYLIGGFSVNEENGFRQYENDVWKSENGKDWSLIKERTYPSNKELNTDWFPRMHHACVTTTHNDTSYIYLIGGYTLQENMAGHFGVHYFNDVWRSANGIDWERLENNDFGIRGKHACAVDPETGIIYLQGGTPGVVYDVEIGETLPVDNYQMLWSSTDGKSWEAVMNNSIEVGMLYRRDHEMLFYKGRLWTLPGRTSNTQHYGFTHSNDYRIWNYTPSGTYHKDGEGAPIDARHGYTTVLFEEKIWVLGGFTNRQGQANDVWCGTLN